MTRALVVGAGGHAKVVADILLCQGMEVLGFLDDDPKTWGTIRLGLRVLGSISAYQDYGCDLLAIGIGDNLARQGVVERLGAAGGQMWCNAIHPAAVVAQSVRLGRGVAIAAGAIVNPDTVIGDYAIINTGATVDHDCEIGAYAHIAPGAHLSGGAVVGRGVLLGIGSCVAPLKSIGDWAIVGAGAAVVRDIPSRVVAKGVPARWSSK